MPDDAEEFKRSRRRRHRIQLGYPTLQRPPRRHRKATHPALPDDLLVAPTPSAAAWTNTATGSPRPAAPRPPPESCHGPDRHSTGAEADQRPPEPARHRFNSPYTWRREIPSSAAASSASAIRTCGPRANDRSPRPAGQPPPTPPPKPSAHPAPPRRRPRRPRRSEHQYKTKIDGSAQEYRNPDFPKPSAISPITAGRQ